MNAAQTIGCNLWFHTHLSDWPPQLNPTSSPDCLQLLVLQVWTYLLIGTRVWPINWFLKWQVSSLAVLFQALIVELSTAVHISQRKPQISITITLNCYHGPITQTHICTLLCLHDQKKTLLCIQPKEEQRRCSKSLKANVCVRDWLIGLVIFIITT